MSSSSRTKLRPQECGTVCRLTYETQSCHTPGSGGRWTRFYFNSRTTAHCELFFLTAPSRNIRTYLRTNLWSVNSRILFTKMWRKIAVRKLTGREVVCQRSVRLSTTSTSDSVYFIFCLHSRQNAWLCTGWPKKVSHYRESSLNRIKNRQPG